VIRIAKAKIIEASLDQVWDIISDQNNENGHWTAIKNIRILRENGNTIEREEIVMRGLIGDVKSIQTLLLDPKKTISLKLTGGPMIGTRKITLTPQSKDRTKVDVVWELELKGIPEFAETFVKNRILELTENALARIARDAEA